MKIYNTEPAAIRTRFAKLTKHQNGKRELTMSEFHSVTDYAFFNTHGYNYNREGYLTDDVENIIKLVDILNDEIINNQIPKKTFIKIDEVEVKDKKEVYTKEELLTKYNALKGTDTLFKLFDSLSNDEKSIMLDIQKEFNKHNVKKHWN